jgi:hypothetical protein
MAPASNLWARNAGGFDAITLIRPAIIPGEPGPNDKGDAGSANPGSGRDKQGSK